MVLILSSLQAKLFNKTPFWPTIDFPELGTGYHRDVYALSSEFLSILLQINEINNLQVVNITIFLKSIFIIY